MKQHNGMKRVYVKDETEAHNILKKSFKLGTCNEYDSARFYKHEMQRPMFRVGAILAQGYAIVYPNGDSILTTVSL